MNELEKIGLQKVKEILFLIKEKRLNSTTGFAEQYNFLKMDIDEAIKVIDALQKQ